MSAGMPDILHSSAVRSRSGDVSDSRANGIMNWHKQPLPVFIKRQFLSSPEGRICTGMCFIYLVVVVPGATSPDLINLAPELFAKFAALFLS